MARKTQRITFILDQQSDGQVSVTLIHHPKLPPNEEAFNKLSYKRKCLANAAADISRYAMERLASDRKGNCQTK